MYFYFLITIFSYSGIQAIMTLPHDRSHYNIKCLHRSHLKMMGELAIYFREIKAQTHDILEQCFVVAIHMKYTSSERITLKRNEKCIKLCLIYGIYMLLTSQYKVLFPWPSLSLMYYLSVNVMHSEHNSYGNISAPTAALLHP